MPAWRAHPAQAKGLRHPARKTPDYCVRCAALGRGAWVEGAHHESVGTTEYLKDTTAMTALKNTDAAGLVGELPGSTRPDVYWTSTMTSSVTGRAPRHGPVRR